MSAPLTNIIFLQLRSMEATAFGRVLRHSTLDLAARDGALETDIAEAMRQRGMRADWTAESLALHTQAVLQGAFILAKAKNGAEIAAASIDHLRRYIELFFRSAPTKPRRKS